MDGTICRLLSAEFITGDPHLIHISGIKQDTNGVKMQYGIKKIFVIKLLQLSFL